MIWPQFAKTVLRCATFQSTIRNTSCPWESKYPPQTRSRQNKLSEIPRVIIFIALIYSCQFLTNLQKARLSCSRVSQNFKHRIFIWGSTNSYSLRKRNAEKCQNYQNRTMFKGAYSASKFYYITRLYDMGENTKIDFFHVFHFKLYFYFNNHKSS